MPTRWRIPPESSRGSAPSKPVSPISLIAASARFARSALATPRASSPSSTLACTVSHGNSANDWNTMPTPRAGPCRGWSRSRTSPLSAPIRPAMMRSMVDLPEPLCPSSATISPSASRKSTPSSTVRWWPSADLNDLPTFLNSTIAGAMGALLQKCMRSSAMRYRRRHTKWFMPITNTHITPMPRATRGKSPVAVMWAM